MPLFRDHNLFAFSPAALSFVEENFGVLNAEQLDHLVTIGLKQVQMTDTEASWLLEALSTPNFPPFEQLVEHDSLSYIR